MTAPFLPVNRQDLQARGWDGVDVLLVTGDAYVDHPAFGAAVIGRILEAAGFRVGVIAQPDWRGLEDFTRLGRPRLFAGITAGNVDSLVANYTANKRPRKKDDYSPGGKTGLRPDRATIVYANRLREVFPGIPVVLGGIEASLRRLAHYDYWENTVRRSLLLDARGDLLVFGMGEVQVVEIARRLSGGEEPSEMNGIRGTAVIREDHESLGPCILLPSYEEVCRDPAAFNEAVRLSRAEEDPVRGRPVAQRHRDRWVIQFPPALPLEEGELDRIYELPYRREWHPSYGGEGGVKALDTVRFSVVSHRGCCGDCRFCSLSLHQGRIVQSRSGGSLIREVESLSRRSDFRGTISDVGGPTVNLYRATCSRWKERGACAERECLFPEKCGSLHPGYEESLSLLKALRKIPGVNHVFLSSGFRYDLLIREEARVYFEEVLRHHTSGRMKVAPEHVSDKVLSMMGKPGREVYEKFLRLFERLNGTMPEKRYLVNYFLNAHPGAGLREALDLGLYCLNRRTHPEQVQDFIPLPMTLSAAMYHTGFHPLTGEAVQVAQTFRERKLHRALVQYGIPANRPLVLEALRKLDACHLEKTFSGGFRRDLKGKERSMQRGRPLKNGSIPMVREAAGSPRRKRKKKK